MTNKQEPGSTYITTKYRVRPGVLTLIKYLEWKEIRGNEDGCNKHLLDEIIKNALSLLAQGKVSVDRDFYRKRKDYSLTLSLETIELINTKYKIYRWYKGELLEVCLLIHAKKNLTDEELKMNGLDQWNVRLTFTE